MCLPISSVFINLILNAKRAMAEKGNLTFTIAKENETQLRIELAKEAVSDIPGVEVVGFRSLLVECARTKGVGVILRGVRAVSDFEFDKKII